MSVFKNFRFLKFTMNLLFLKTSFLENNKKNETKNDNYFQLTTVSVISMTLHEKMVMPDSSALTDKV